MLHDDLNALVQKFIRTYEKRPEKRELLKEFKSLFSSPPIAFYFDETVGENLELWQTAKEFGAHGLLRLPFENCIFHCANIFHDVEGAKYKDLTISLRQVDEDTISFLKWKKVNGVWSCDAFAGQIYLSRQQFDLYCIDGERDFEEKTTTVLTCLGQVVMVLLMLINHPVYEKKEHDIDDKLQRARAKRGKVPLSKYIYVGMRPEIRAALTAGDGTIRSPHWRRGHVRRLGDGRVVPVQACLVNWDGDPEDVKKKIYVMKGNQK